MMYYKDLQRAGPKRMSTYQSLGYPLCFEEKRKERGMEYDNNDYIIDKIDNYYDINSITSISSSKISKFISFNNITI